MSAYFSDLLFSAENSDFSKVFFESFPKLKSLLYSDAQKFLDELSTFSKSGGKSINVMMALAFFCSAFELRDFYMEKNIPEKVYLDTLGELPRTVDVYFERHGEYGLDEAQIHWLPLHVTGKLFRLGRLQFEMMKFGMDLDFLKKDANVVMTHIPSDSKLLHEECLKSYADAKDFFPKYIGYNIDAFVCYSWLLSPAVSEILGKDSNIAQFASDFNLFEVHPDRNEDAIHFIFRGITPYPQNTRLQREIKKRLDSGLGIGEAFGYFYNR